jgi:putative redox protein
MEMTIDFPGGSRVDAHFNGLIVPTDQPSQGCGQGSAPTPFDTFLASIGTCAGIYVLGFCRQRGIPAEGIRLKQRIEYDHTSGMVNLIDLEILLPKEFPDKYKQAVILAADQCKVKKHLEHPPKIDVKATTAE